MLVSNSAAWLSTVDDSKAAVYSLKTYVCRVYVDICSVKSGVVDLVVSVFVVVFIAVVVAVVDDAVVVSA